MNKRALGAGGFKIGEVGLGCWQFGGDFGPMAAETAGDIMKTAVENGIDFFDTADVYGDGRSEGLIGKFLATGSHSVTVATKFGRGANVYPEAYTKEALRASAIASIERLGVEAIDLLQLHCIPTAVLRQGDVFDWLREIKTEGLIRHFGASVESVEEALICLEQEGLLTLQVIFNIFRQKLISDLFPRAQARGVGIIIRLPLASGLLSGKFNKETRFAETDHRHFNRDGQHFNVGETFAGLPFEKGVELAETLKADIPDGISMAQMALRWILDHEAVSVIIPGASSPAQAASNAAVSGMAPLADQVHAKFNDFYIREVQHHIRGPY
jgi:aryl-alcohol dehydrogenase-like predicted oxidoreductase